MPRSTKGRRSKVRSRRRRIAIASFATILIAVGLGRWIAGKTLRASPPRVEVAKKAPIHTVVQQFLPIAETPEPREIAPMPSAVAEVAAQTLTENEFYPVVLDEGGPRGKLKSAPRDFPKHVIARRINEIESDALELELAKTVEVGLATALNPTLGTDLATAAKRAENLKKRFAGSVVMARNRPELAGLPFRVGSETRLPEEAARNMNDMSKDFRDAVAKSTENGGFGRSPNVAKLYALLNVDAPEVRIGSKPSPDEISIKPWRWSAPEAVPCIQQMLQAEGYQLRRMSCALLRDNDSPAATEALVKWAVFDTNAGNRAAAVEMLRGRDREQVGAQLLEWSRYPWVRAVEHACEAMVELGMKEILPGLAVLLAQHDPDAPFEAELPGTGAGAYRREIVRVNHLRNCLMCHPASFKTSELVRGAVPDENQILPPSTPAYYGGTPDTRLRVSAATTYLKQDFSLVQSVEKPGKWPAQQRFDYFVSTRQIDRETLRTYVPNAESKYKLALRFAIRELAGSGLERDLEWLAGQRKLAAPLKDHRRLAAAQTYALRAGPEAFIAFKMAEFVTPIYDMYGPELAAMFKKFETTNPNVLKGAMIAYLEPLLDRKNDSERQRIARLLALARTPEQELGEFLGLLAAMRN